MMVWRRWTYGWLVMLSCLLSATLMGQELRTWTNTDGRSVEAAYVRLDNDSVVIRNSQGEFRVELVKLSENDRTYVRDLEAQREAKRAVRQEVRAWKFFGGESFQGRLVGIIRGKAQFRSGSRVVSKAWYELDAEDREHLYDLWEAGGELELQVKKLQEDQTTKTFIQNDLESRDRKRERQRQQEERMAAKLIAEQSPRPESLPVAQPLTTPEPIESSAEEATSPMPVEGPTQQPPPIVATPPLPRSPPPPVTQQPIAASDRGGERDMDLSGDPLERARAGNQAAYYFLWALLGILVIFGPILYVLRRS